MANLDDLPIPSITNMTPDEAIEHLRQIRLARRTPAKMTASVARKKEAKASAKQPPKLSAEQAAEMLKLLEEGI